MKTDYKTNQYVVMAEKNKYDRQLVAQKNAATLQSAEIRANAFPNVFVRTSSKRLLLGFAFHFIPEKPF